MLFRIVYNYVGLAVEDLHPVFVVGMKALAGLIDREGYVFPRILIPHVEQHFIGVLHTKRMAIHTVLTAVFVFHDRALLIIFQIPLVNTHLIPKFVSGFDQAISQI